jgi:AAA domain/Bifunctional DNA primase/polymerase, N-terminal
MAMARVSFDPTWGGPADWASMYRSHGLQVVPAHMPKPKPAQWKFPAVKQWKQFQEELIPQSLFDRWYAVNGLYFRHANMGLITGRASGNIFVLDLDTYKESGAAQWWQAQLHLNNYGEIPHSWRARTGGGGQHLFFKAPEGWLIPNNATPLGVDVKGQGGFVVLPPSLHTDGVYAWEPGFSPYEVGELEEAPQWLLDAIDAVAEAYGGHKPETRSEDGERVETPTPTEDHNVFGKRVDGREREMRDIVYHGLLEFRRSGGRLDTPAEEAALQAAFSRYLLSTSTRLTGVDNATGLELEGRGLSLFRAKWVRLATKWNTPELAEAAAKPNPKTAPAEPFDTRLELAFTAPLADASLEVLDIPEVKNMAPPKWLIEDVMPEQSLGFIFGPPGSYKSFIALSQALALATRRESWWGHTIAKPGAVVYISSEGHTDLKFRIAAWEAQNGVNADDAPFYLIRVPLNLMRVDDVAKVLHTLEAIKARAGCGITAVYVDTVSRVMPGADENLQKDMTLFIAACDAIRARFQATVCGVHHTSRAGGSMRGSTVFDGASDFLLQIEREEGAERGTLIADKIKAAKDGWKEPFTMIKHELPMGRSSLVSIRTLEPRTTSEGWPEKSVCRDILKAIGKAWNDGQPWSPHPQAKREGNYAPRQIEIAFGVSAELGARMVMAWLENRVLTYERQTTKNHPRGLKVIGWID